MNLPVGDLSRWMTDSRMLMASHLLLIVKARKTTFFYSTVNKKGKKLQTFGVLVDFPFLASFIYAISSSSVSWKQTNKVNSCIKQILSFPNCLLVAAGLCVLGWSCLCLRMHVSVNVVFALSTCMQKSLCVVQTENTPYTYSKVLCWLISVSVLIWEQKMFDIVLPDIDSFLSSRCNIPPQRLRWPLKAMQHIGFADLEFRLWTWHLLFSAEWGSCVPYDSSAYRIQICTICSFKHSIVNKRKRH